MDWQGKLALAFISQPSRFVSAGFFMMAWMAKIIDEKQRYRAAIKSGGALKEKEEWKRLLFFMEDLGLLWRLACV